MGYPEGSCCEVVLIRHGETDWNRVGRIQGQEDIPLNDTGRSQVRAAAETLSETIKETPGTFPEEAFSQDTFARANDVLATAFYTSPLSRALESAHIVADVINFDRKDVQIEPSVIEWNAGPLQGVLLKDIASQHPEAWKAWKLQRDPFYILPEGGESFAARYKRVTQAIQNIANKHQRQRVLIVCHAGVLDDIYRRAKQIPLEVDTHLPKLNAGIYILHIFNDTTPHEDGQLPKWKVLRWGAKKVPDRRVSVEFQTIPSEKKDKDTLSTVYA